MTFGENLKYIRKQQQLTQEQLGQMVGVSGVAIGRFEASSRTPRKEMVKKLADALNVNPAELDSDLSVSIGKTTVYSIKDGSPISVPKGSAEDKALKMCRTLSKASLEYWFAIGNALAEFPENRR